MRIKYLDFLKVLSIFGVVIIHATSNQVVNFSGSSSIWWINNIFNSLVRWCVPVFFLVSGSLVLNSEKNYSIRKFYRHKIFPLFKILLVWSIFYFLLLMFTHVYSDNISFNLQSFIILFLKGEIYSRLWFLYTLIGIYMISPLLKVFVDYANLNQIKLFIFLWVSCTSLVTILQTIFNIELIFELNTITGYFGYFVLGYYLRSKIFSPKFIRNFLMCTIVSLILTIIGTYFLSRNSIQFNGLFYHYLAPNTIVISIGIFLFVKHYLYNIGNDVITSISNNTLGIYLIHSIILEIFDYVGISQLNITPILYIPFISLIVVVISWLISATIGRISLLKKILLV